MRRVAVLIGTNTYNDDAYPDLRSPRADVDAISAELRANGHFDDVQTLTDPTHAEASGALEEALAGGPNDLVFVSISGHGAKNRRGRLHLAFRDTRDGRLASTGLPTETLQRMLEDSRVGSKVLLLDCCYSGAFAEGFTTRAGDDDIDFERELSSGEGTYVLAASGALERAYEGDASGAPVPSPFSAAVARGLAGAAPDGNGDGWIDALELYQHVDRETSGDRQKVTAFALGYQGPIRLARRVDSLTATPLSQSTPEPTAPSPGTAHDVGGDPADPDSTRRRGPQAPWDVRQWKALFTYYHSCLTRQSVLQELPDVNGTQSVPCDMGSEELLSGASERWRVRGRAADLVATAKKNGQALRYGYPTVLFDAARGGNGGKRAWKVAPLLVMDVDAVDDGVDETLVPVGEPMLNTAVLVGAAELNPDELDELLTWFVADWSGSGVAGLGDKARSVCERLSLPRVHDLVPGELRGGLDLARPYRTGAQNVAVLHLADKAAAAVKQLVSDLDVHGEHALRTDRIPQTALGALSGQGPAAHAPRSVRPVITGNSNDAQEEILRSAMTEPLTVATGAPGTGKSQLITSVVTTAVSAEDSVLVASTNNTAVDEVVNRANELLPGADLVVRTGNAEKREREPAILTDLRVARFGTPDSRTAAESLANHDRRMGAARRTLAEVAEAERRLAVLSLERARHVANLPGSLAPESFPDARALAVWTTRVERALQRRWPRRWHQWRVRRGLGITGAHEELVAVLRFLTTEREWREARRVVDGRPDPTGARDTINTARDRRATDSAEYLVGRVAEGVRQGHGVIDARLQALNSGGSSWKGVPKLLSAVRAWATTSRSVRGVFPPNPGLFDLVVVDEASQCTVPDLIPLLFRAKRALVIGDPHQLQPVNTLEYRDDQRYQMEAGLNEQWLEDRSLIFTQDSAYHASAAALAASDGRVLWLDEHYRCHPDIVTPVNRRFYANRLAIRTRPWQLAAPADPALRWIDVRGQPDRPGGFSCRNRSEAERVIELLRELWRELPDDVRIGVVTPFAAQLWELRSRLGRRGGERIRAGTVHTFQGGERDVIVVSPTAATGVDRRPGGWAARSQNLWNVAVTRARSRLYVVGDQEYWAKREGVLSDIARVDGDGAAGELPPDTGRTALFGALRDRGVAPTVGLRVAGYHCDLSVPTPNGDVAVVVDWAGVHDPVAPAPARSLQRTLDRTTLFESVSGIATLRVPAWRCLTEPALVAGELLDTARSSGNADARTRREPPDESSRKEGR